MYKQSRAPAVALVAATRQNLLLQRASCACARAHIAWPLIESTSQPAHRLGMREMYHEAWCNGRHMPARSACTLLFIRLMPDTKAEFPKLLWVDPMAQLCGLAILVPARALPAGLVEQTLLPAAASESNRYVPRSWRSYLLHNEPW